MDEPSHFDSDDDMDALFGFTAQPDDGGSLVGGASSTQDFWEELSNLQTHPSQPISTTSSQSVDRDPFNDRSVVEAKVQSILEKKAERAARNAARGSVGRGSTDLELQQRFLFNDDHLVYSTTYDCKCGCYCASWFDKQDVELIRCVY